MSIRMQQRRGTEEQWTLSNPVLAPGELGFETNTNKFKIGDGVNQWDDLSYFVDFDALDLGGSLDDYVPLTSVGTSVASLDGSGQVPLSQLGNVPEADLTGLATESYVDSAIEAIPAADFTGYATESFVSSAVSGLVDSAPATLDTLNELAAALGDDANFAATVSTSLGEKAPTNSPTFTGTVSGVTKAHVGLGNVDNTSDTNKPVSTATQTALDAKAAVSHSHNANAITYTVEDKTANYTIVAADEGKLVRSTGAAITVTVADVFAIGEVITFTQSGAGQITFSPAGGVTLQSVETKRKTNKQFSTVQIVKVAASTYQMFGDLAA